METTRQGPYLAANGRRPEDAEAVEDVFQDGLVQSVRVQRNVQFRKYLLWGGLRRQELHKLFGGGRPPVQAILFRRDLHGCGDWRAKRRLHIIRMRQGEVKTIFSYQQAFQSEQTTSDLVAFRLQIRALEESGGNLGGNFSLVVRSHRVLDAGGEGTAGVGEVRADLEELRFHGLVRAQQLALKSGILRILRRTHRKGVL